LDAIRLVSIGLEDEVIAAGRLRFAPQHRGKRHTGDRGVPSMPQASKSVAPTSTRLTGFVNAEIARETSNYERIVPA